MLQKLSFQTSFRRFLRIITATISPDVKVIIIDEKMMPVSAVIVIVSFWVIVSGGGVIIIVSGSVVFSFS